MDLKRDLVKYIRDKAKNKYDKGTECYICGEKTQLDFHHFYSLSPLVHNYVKKNKLLPENILSFREDFIQEHWAELYEHTVTLCHAHHLKLHKVGEATLRHAACYSYFHAASAHAHPYPLPCLRSF